MYSFDIIHLYVITIITVNQMIRNSVNQLMCTSLIHFLYVHRCSVCGLRPCDSDCNSLRQCALPSASKEAETCQEAIKAH